MQFRFIDKRIKINDRINGSLHSLAQAAQDDNEALVESIRKNGYNERRPVILVVESWMLSESAWRWDDMGDDDTRPAIAQGRHRWLAAQELSMESVPCVCMTPAEWQDLRDCIGEANEVEMWLMQRIDDIIDADGDDVSFEL